MMQQQQMGAVTNAISQLVSTMNAAQQTAVAQQAAQHAAAMQQQQQQPPAPAAHHQHGVIGRIIIKPPDVATFSGDRKHPDRYPAKDFINGLDNYYSMLEQQTGQEPADGVKLLYAVGRLTKEAEQWWKTASQQRPREQWDYDAFVNALLQEFGQYLEGFNKIMQWYEFVAAAMHNTGRNRDLQAYHDSYLRVVNQVTPALDGLHKVVGYVAGLPRWIRVELVDRLGEDFTTWGFTDASQLVLTRAQTRRHLTPATSGDAPRPRDRNDRNDRHYSGPAPMDINAVDVAGVGKLGPFPPPAGSRWKPLSRPERDHLMANHGCLYCRRLNVDHTATNCPSKAQRQQPRSGPPQGNGKPK